MSHLSNQNKTFMPKEIPGTEKFIDRHNQNLAFFKTAIPKIYQKIIDSDAIPKLTIDPTSGKVQRVEHGQEIYAPNPMDFALNEVHCFLEKVANTDYRPKKLHSYLPHIIDKKAFKKTIRLFTEDKNTSEPEKDYLLDLVIFGCGIGYHVEMLINCHRFRNVLIIENDMARFKGTLYTLNWENILTSLPSNKIITLIINQDKEDELKTEQFNHEIRVECVNLFPSGTLSTIKFTHAPDGQEHENAKKILIEYANHFQVLYEKIGPDGQRLLNANENIRRGYKILNLKETQLITNKNIAIVGAGPSLDIYKDTLIAHREKFFIISAGSALSSLVNMQIMPDLHLELEYKILMRDLLHHLNSKHTLKNITLVATVETQPDVTHLFDNCYHFVPESSEVASMVNRDAVMLKAGINCVVSALALADYISDRQQDLFLFGIDFAYTDNKHHSSSNISMDTQLPDSIKKLNPSPQKILQKSTMAVEDTHGNKVKTTLVLNSSRLAMNDVLKNLERKIHNCSYGAKLENTTFLDEKDLISIIDHGNYITQHTLNYVFIKSDYRIINEKSIDLVKSAIHTAKEVQKIIKEGIKKDYKIPIVIFQLMQELDKIKHLYQRRTTYSIVRLPIYLLYLISNFSSEKNLNSIIKQWDKDFSNYLKIVENKVLYQLKSDNQTINEEWTDMAFV